MNQGNVSSTDFRLDINGLRAWAVVSVVLYHFGVPGFQGGFVGVDVFFVISGFLMTGIVVSGLERGNFSVLAFYMARARRILPALIALCAVLMALGWWLLHSLDYKALATHVIASLVFLSNIKFWRESGYFDLASHEKWLLHTWSLAVEWQFYLVLPLLLLVAWKWRPNRRVLSLAMGAGFLLSLGYSIVLTSKQPSAAFYLLPTRAWEMIAGGLVYLWLNHFVLTKYQRKALELVGLIFILAAVFAFDSSSSWPGWLALVPVIGAMLILQAARNDSHFTGNQIAQWLGTRSYSLYLWHWPIVVALVYLEQLSNPMAVSTGVVLTLLLGHLSYHWIENTARKKISMLGSKRGMLVLVCCVLAVLVPSAMIRLTDGVRGRVATDIDLIASEALNKNPRMSTCHTEANIVSASCLHGGKKLSAILLGDSHASAVVSGFAQAMPHPDDAVMEWSYAGCPSILGVQMTPVPARPDSRCKLFLDWAVDQLQTIPKDIPLVIVNRLSLYALGPNEPWEPGANANIPIVYFNQIYNSATPEYLAEFSQRHAQTVCQLAKTRRVYLVRPIPEMGVHIPNTSRAMVFGRKKEMSIAVEEYQRRNAFAWAAQNAAQQLCGVTILNPLPYLCWDGRCHGSKAGRPLYYDDDHLSEYGNKLLTPMFAEVFASK